MKSQTPTPKSEIPHPLPNGWRWVRLGEVCRFRHGSTPSKADRTLWNGDVLWVSPKDMYADVLMDSQDKISRLALDRTRIAEVPEGTVLVVIRSGVLAHTLPVAIAGRPLTFNQDIKGILPNSTVVDGTYLRWVLEFNESRILSEGIKQGATVPSIRSGYIEAFRIPLPPLSEQNRISEILKSQMASVENARAAAMARLEAAKALPAAFLRQVFEATLAARWPRLEISLLGDPIRGDAVQTGPFGAQLPSSEFRTEGVPVLNIGNVKEGRIVLDRLDFVSPHKADQLERYRVRRGDMLFTRSGSVGRSAVVPDTCDGWLISYHLLRVAFDSARVEPGFISAAIRGDRHVLNQIRIAAGRGATRDGVNASILAALRVPCPSIEVQQNVLRQFDEFLNLADRVATSIEHELQTISALPAALLRQAFTGEIKSATRTKEQQKRKQQRQTPRHPAIRRPSRQKHLRHHAARQLRRGDAIRARAELDSVSAHPR